MEKDPSIREMIVEIKKGSGINSIEEVERFRSIHQGLVDLGHGDKIKEQVALYENSNEPSKLSLAKRIRNAVPDLFK